MALNKKLWKRIGLAVLVLALAGAAAVWYILTEKFTDTTERKAAYSVNATDFIKEFETNEAEANKKYTEKIVSVTGIISAIEAADTTANIKFADTLTGSYVIFAFQEQHLSEAKQLKAGDAVTIKGSCSGGVYSEILEAHSIAFKRAAVDKKP